MRPRTPTKTVMKTSAPEQTCLAGRRRSLVGTKDTGGRDMKTPNRCTNNVRQQLTIRGLALARPY